MKRAFFYKQSEGLFTKKAEQPFAFPVDDCWEIIIGYLLPDIKALSVVCKDLYRVVNERLPRLFASEVPRSVLDLQVWNGTTANTLEALTGKVTRFFLCFSPGWWLKWNFESLYPSTLTTGQHVDFVRNLNLCHMRTLPIPGSFEETWIRFGRNHRVSYFTLILMELDSRLSKPFGNYHKNVAKTTDKILSICATWIRESRESAYSALFWLLQSISILTTWPKTPQLILKLFVIGAPRYYFPLTLRPLRLIKSENIFGNFNYLVVCGALAEYWFGRADRPAYEYNESGLFCRAQACSLSQPGHNPQKNPLLLIGETLPVYWIRIMSNWNPKALKSLIHVHLDPYDPVDMKTQRLLFLQQYPEARQCSNRIELPPIESLTDEILEWQSRSYLRHGDYSLSFDALSLAEKLRYFSSTAHLFGCNGYWAFAKVWAQWLLHLDSDQLIDECLVKIINCRGPDDSHFLIQLLPLYIALYPKWMERFPEYGALTELHQSLSAKGEEEEETDE